MSNPMRESDDIDPVTLEILRNSLQNAAEEMGETLLRTAYSSVIREARDCSTALFGPDGDLIAQAEHIPMHLGSMPYALDANFKRADELTEDEILIFNDPYHGGQHIVDIVAFQPVFLDGERVGFAGSIAHHIDMGGGGAASLGPEVATTYGEGFRFPPLTLDLNSREFEHFVDTLATNVRASEYVVGDFNAQLSASRRGVERLEEIAGKYGTDLYLEALNSLDSYAERFMRSRIAELPDSAGTGTETVEVDAPEAVADADTTVRVEVRVNGDEIGVDFDGTAPEVPGYINSPIASTHSAAYFAILAALGGSDLPISAGIYRPIELTVPSGTIVNPTEPTATRARMKTAGRVYDAVLQALAQIAPEVVPAGAFNSTTPIVFGKQFEGHTEVFMDLPGGGWGGYAGGDGAPATTNPLENELNIPVEALEQDHPWLCVNAYQLRTDSGGPGEFRGGLGVRRAFEVVDGPATGTGYTGRVENGAGGVNGGKPGGTGRVRCNRSTGTSEDLGTTWELDLASGDEVEVEMGGGGGYGSVAYRDIDAIARDVASDFVSFNGAVTDYDVEPAQVRDALESLLGTGYDAFAEWYGWSE
ncbi:hydantoinase B/oxoprolinase family protein [Natronosalvus rutilus]|uniref:Hydantoinase B/oxoprolinase family protein n=1 Tax=Natronosalvus rutilus TaxID=2953753 RepID=A0A9E7NF75_9EURY|nr:hydantoinase B/oxoprolinase family protein [Natronosalvus rutilus]UTF55657.1 hydantoinase B/oxoprolinase family protein [Natronosalvus rutilus]